MKRFAWGGLAWLGLLCLCLACSQPAEPPIQEVVIGLLVDNDRPIHQPVLNAARLAVQDLTRRGGLQINDEHYQVVLAVEDDISSPEQAARAAYRLINQNRVSALVGCNLSRNAIPVGRVAQQVEIPMISPASTHPLTTRHRPFVFRVAFTDPEQGQMMARFAFQELDLRRVAILFNTAEVYSIGVQEAFRLEFESLGGSVVETRSYLNRDEDMRAALEALRDAQPQALFLPNYTWDIPPIVQQMDALDWQVQLLGGEGWTTEILASNPLLEGAYVIQHWNRGAVDNNPTARRFLAEYETEHAQAPYSISALTFDALHLLFQAIERSNSVEPDDIRRQLAATESFAGVTGSITFKGRGGDPSKPAVLVRLLDGEITFQRWLDP